jgi:hypothetical protein
MQSWQYDFSRMEWVILAIGNTDGLGNGLYQEKSTT